jgi:hypothetical protein
MVPLGLLMSSQQAQRSGGSAKTISDGYGIEVVGRSIQPMLTNL